MHLALYYFYKPSTPLLLLAVVLPLVAFRFRHRFAWPWWIPILLLTFLVALPGLARWHESFLLQPVYPGRIFPDGILLLLTGLVLAVASVIVLRRHRRVPSLLMLLVSLLIISAGIHDVESAHLRWRLGYMGLHGGLAWSYRELLFLIYLIAFLPILLRIRRGQF